MKDVSIYEERDEIVNLYLEGKTDVQIAKLRGIPRMKVKEHLDEFREVARNDETLRNRGREVVHEYDTQQSRIIEQFWEVIREAENTSDLKVRASALKQLSDVQSRRVEVLQRAGLIAENSITDELVATQEKVDILVGILRQIKEEYPQVAEIIASRLRKVTGESETIPVVVVDD